MNNLKRWSVIIMTSGLIALLLVSFLVIAPVFAQGPGGMMGRGMMGGFGYGGATPGGYGPGGMMGYTQGYTSTTPYGYGPGWRGGYGPGHMMGGWGGPGWRGGYGPGHMMGGWGGPGWGGGYGPGHMMGYTGTAPCGVGYGCGTAGSMMGGGSSPFFATAPLTVAEATEAVNAFLVSLNDSNLALGEVMIFDNHAYAQIVEKDSGIGAMEVLVDPVTKAVSPEMGPNMMWNLKYGMMAGYGMGGRFGYNQPGNVTPGAVSAEMPVTPAEAVEAAQAYLSTFAGNNLEVDEHADPFYGYYTLHVNRDGETIGMLSVNGYTGQVFLHTWHGNFIEMTENHPE